MSPGRGERVGGGGGGGVGSVQRLRNLPYGLLSFLLYMRNFSFLKIRFKYQFMDSAR